jgi:hypothetical protein
MDTRHAVGCKALRGGVPCTCWLDEDAPLVAGGCWPSKDAHEPAIVSLVGFFNEPPEDDDLDEGGEG